MTTLKVNKLSADAILPAYQSVGASGLDLHSEETWNIPPGTRRVIGTGIAIEIPYGYEGQVRSRSGLTAAWGIVVLNSPGTIDSDYRGEIKVIIANTGRENFLLKKGDRIAQLVIARVEKVAVTETTELSATERGAAGLGSTGT